MEIKVGYMVRLTKAIFDDGEDHHPPGYLAMAGEIVVVRDMGPPGATRIAVSHENVLDASFMVSRDEYEALA